MQPAARLPRAAAVSLFSRCSSQGASSQLQPTTGRSSPTRHSPRRSSGGLRSSLESLCSSSVTSTPNTPYSASCEIREKFSAIQPVTLLTPTTPDGFYGFGDDNDVINSVEPAGPSETNIATSFKAICTIPDSSAAFVMASPSQSSLLRRRQMRQGNGRPKSCPALSNNDEFDLHTKEPIFKIGQVSSGSIIRRRKAASLKARPKTADFVDDDCAFGFDQEFVVTASRWRGVVLKDGEIS